MNIRSSLAGAALTLLAATPSFLRAAAVAPPLVCDTPHEFFARGDFDGDGRLDLVIADKESGKFRIGYQTAGGGLNWVDCRPSGVKGVAGLGVGKVLTADKTGLVFASPDANQLSFVNAARPGAPDRPLIVPFNAALGPSAVAAVGAASSSAQLDDLFVASIYNSPDANLATWLRNDGQQFPKSAEMTLPGPALRANRLSLAAGQSELLCVLVNDDKGDSLRVLDLRGDKPVAVATASGLPAGSDYAVGDFDGAALREFLFFQPGGSRLLARPLAESAPGQYEFRAAADLDLGQPIRRVLALDSSAGQRLFIIFGQGEKAGVFDFDGRKAPSLLQTFYATNSLFTCAASLPAGFVVFSEPAGGKFSTKYQVFSQSGSTYSAASFGSLPSLADNDNITIPDIYNRIVSDTAIKSEAGMKPYSNNIPGTTIGYNMVPIPSGEFSMGSPAGETGRKPDEGPQHKVKIEPFWMGTCEVTWNEYELFMYPEEERRTRALMPTDTQGDKLADAITHPSRPYVEMSFGMGKDGYPAIAMTQHGANKYCQWLSAKTGHFYRLPTEAEWEYAARAGTTTAYFFGDDPSKLGEYAWYEENSDFKYQKVGKKKPNPWGLYDIYGNVVEWVLDQYDPEYYKQCNAGGEAVEPWNKATKPYPHSARGGSWDNDAAMCRSAARRGSERAWKMTDPQLPKSVWYLSDAQWIGFRIVRPLKLPSAEEMQKYWSSGVERD